MSMGKLCRIKAILLMILIGRAIVKAVSKLSVYASTTAIMYAKSH